ncbi:MAG: MarR family transcriptional regulator [Dehalococcoidia bacterium]
MATRPSSPSGREPDLDQLAALVHSAALHLMRRIRREDEAFGLSAPRMSALSCVVFGGPRTLGELAAVEQVSPPTMTRLVAALERDGFVARKPDTADGRVVWIRPTPKGRRVMEAGRSRRTAFLARKIARLTATERSELARGAAIMMRMYEDARGGS